MKAKRTEVIEVEFDGGHVVVTDDPDKDFVFIEVHGTPNVVSTPGQAGDGPVTLEVGREE